jgi:hypothetical protein
MAASDYITPTPPLLPGTTAKAQDVNEKFDALIAAFNKLPIPAPGGAKGFGQAVEVGNATSDEHALTKGQFDAVIVPLAEAIQQVFDLATDVDPYASVKLIGDTYHVVGPEDNGKILWFESGDPITVVFPGDTQLPFDKSLQGLIVQGGAGVITMEDDGESALLASGGLVESGQQYAPISYFRKSGNEWWVGGERA